MEGCGKIMYHISQEQKDQVFRSWIVDQNHRIEILIAYGFTRDQAIEMLKVQALQMIDDRNY